MLLSLFHFLRLCFWFQWLLRSSCVYQKKRIVNIRMMSTSSPCRLSRALSEELGSILQSFPVSRSSLTHNKHRHFENKMWEIYFYKEVCSFVYLSSYIMFDYVSAYICITAIQHMSIWCLRPVHARMTWYRTRIELDDQRNGWYQHIKKISNEKLKWIWKKKKK